MRRLLLALVLVACPAAASAQCFGASSELALDGSGTYNLTIGSAVSSGDALFVSITQSEEAASISSISDSVNGSWSLAGGVTTTVDDGGGTARDYLGLRLNSGAGTPVITIVISAGSGGTGRAWACPAATANTFEEWTTNIVSVATNTPATASGNATCTSGMFTGILWTNSARDIASLDSGTNLTPITGRQHIIYRSFSSAGALSAITATLGSSLTARAVSAMAVTCASGGGGGGSTRAKDCTLLGVCE